MADLGMREAQKTLATFTRMFESIKSLEEAARVVLARESEMGELDARLAEMKSKLETSQAALASFESDERVRVKALEDEEVKVRRRLDAEIDRIAEEMIARKSHAEQAMRNIDSQYHKAETEAKNKLAALQKDIEEREGRIAYLNRQIGELKQAVGSM